MNILLLIAQLPWTTFSYHPKRRSQPDKYKETKEIITAIYLQKFESIAHFKKELVEYLDYYNNHRIKVKKGLPPAMHRQQAFSAA